MQEPSPSSGEEKEEIPERYEITGYVQRSNPHRATGVTFDDMDQMLPVSIMLIGMPISGSIGHAIGLGLISYTVVKLLSGKAKDVSVLTYVISALFLIKFFAVV